jgi:hypothetical protein
MRLPKLGIPWLRVSDGEMQLKALGRLPPSVAAADSLTEPEPEYIAEAAPTPEDVWAREQARYQARRDRDDPDTS